MIGMDIINTIIPIFVIIFLGWIMHQRGFIPNNFITPANRLVYYLAIPAMVFRAISQNIFSQYFNVYVVIISLVSMMFIFAASLLIGKLYRLKSGHLSTFVQSTYHCNIGYLALAVAYYYLGNEGFARAGILAGFLMILQNLLSVMILNFYSSELPSGRNRTMIVSKIFANPIILSALAGIIFSLGEIALPKVIYRTLDIIGGLALPTALLIIGASLSFHVFKRQSSAAIVASIIKLLVFPGIAFILFNITGTRPIDYMPAFILLASPTATVTYVMAKEMKGNIDLAAAAISASTLLSSITYTAWLTFIT